MIRSKSKSRAPDCGVSLTFFFSPGLSVVFFLLFLFPYSPKQYLFVLCGCPFVCRVLLAVLFFFFSLFVLCVIRVRFVIQLIDSMHIVFMNLMHLR